MSDEEIAKMVLPKMPTTTWSGLVYEGAPHEKRWTSYQNGYTEENMIDYAYAAVAAERERCAQYLRDAAERLAPEGKRINQIDRHTAHVLACKGDELAAGRAWRDVGEEWQK